MTPIAFCGADVITPVQKYHVGVSCSRQRSSPTTNWQSGQKYICIFVAYVRLSLWRHMSSCDHFFNKCVYVCTPWPLLNTCMNNAERTYARTQSHARFIITMICVWYEGAKQQRIKNKHILCTKNVMWFFFQWLNRMWDNVTNNMYNANAEPCRCATIILSLLLSLAHIQYYSNDKYNCVFLHLMTIKWIFVC